MKTYPTDELEKKVVILSTLARTHVLLVLQTIPAGVKKTQHQISNETELPLAGVYGALQLLQAVDIVMHESEPGFGDNFMLAPNMPDLAQAVILAIWPNWFEGGE